MNSRAVICIILVSIFAFSGVCFSAEPGKATSQNVAGKTKEAAKTTGAFAEQKKEEYVRDIQQEYDRLSRQISELKAEAGARASEEYKKQLVRLEASKDAAGQKLDALKRTSARKWESMKKSMDTAMADLRSTYEEAVSRLKRV